MMLIVLPCAYSGAQDYLPKPINGTVLLAKVISSLEENFLEEKGLSMSCIQATTDQLTGIANRK